MRHDLSPTTVKKRTPWARVGTESRSGFTAPSSRGSALDLDTTNTQNTNGNAAYERPRFDFTTATSGHLAGGHFWCFKDDASPDNTVGDEGVVDRFCVPKVMYWYFRKQWTSLAPDYPRPGTATAIDLQADTNTLYATGGGIFLIPQHCAMQMVAPDLLRFGECDLYHQLGDHNRHVLRRQSHQSLRRPCGGIPENDHNTRYLYGNGKLPEYPHHSPADDHADYAGLACETYVNGPTAVAPQRVRRAGAFKLGMTAGALGFSFRCPRPTGTLRRLTAGRSVLLQQRPEERVGIIIARRTLGSGLDYAVWEGAGQKLVSRINTVN